jgi:hypothetical protein
MLNVGAEDSGMFYDFDHDQFLEPLSDVDDTQPAIVSPLEDTETINAAHDDGGEVEARSALSPQAPLPSFRQIHDGVVTPEMETMLKAESPHPAITGILKRRI